MSSPAPVSHLPYQQDNNSILHEYRQQTISLPEAVDHELDAYQKRIEKPEYPGISGTKCLNLIVVVPAGARSLNGIPVLVYIHGGGFSVGANWWPQFDMKHIVQLSVDSGSPVIGINIKRVLSFSPTPSI